MGVNSCDTDRGPCACGAWHVVEADPNRPVKTLLKAAKDLRAAQRDYMAIRSEPVSPAIKEFAGARVGQEAAELDRAIEAVEKRQATPLRAVEPSLGEQREMGVHPSGGEVTP